MRLEAISLPVTNPVLPRSLDCSALSSVISRGVVARSGGGVIACTTGSGGGDGVGFERRCGRGEGVGEGEWGVGPL